MTANQLAYWQLQETKRHNLALEDLEQQKATETGRANIARERETNRSNLVSESEQYRYHTLENLLGLRNAAITASHFKNTEFETERHNQANEFLEMTKHRENLAETKEHNDALETNQFLAQFSESPYQSSYLDYLSSALDETKRHNETEELIYGAQTAANISTGLMQTIFGKNGLVNVNSLLSTIGG